MSAVLIVLARSGTERDNTYLIINLDTETTFANLVSPNTRNTDSARAHLHHRIDRVTPLNITHDPNFRIQYKFGYKQKFQKFYGDKMGRRFFNLIRYKLFL